MLCLRNKEEQDARKSGPGSHTSRSEYVITVVYLIGYSFQKAHKHTPPHQSSPATYLTSLSWQGRGKGSTGDRFNQGNLRSLDQLKGGEEEEGDTTTDSVWRCFFFSQFGNTNDSEGSSTTSPRSDFSHFSGSWWGGRGRVGSFSFSSLSSFSSGIVLISVVIILALRRALASHRRAEWHFDGRRPKRRLM